jgi:hypothetical protein
MTRRSAFIGWIVLAIAPAVWAQPGTDFSGAWILDVAKSDKPQSGAPLSPGTLRIEQTPIVLTTSASNGQQTVTMRYRLDGSESINEVGTTIRTVATWDGPRLVLHSISQYVVPGGELTFDSTEVYSVAGSTLTITSSSQLLPSGDRFPTTKMVFTKQ